MRRIARAVCVVAGSAGVMTVGGCGGGDTSPGATPGAAAQGTITEERRLPAQPPSIPAWEPGPTEKYANGKRLAARVAQQSLTYARGATAAQVARRVDPQAIAAGTLAPSVRAGSRSWARVVYPQLSGLTPDTLGAMVVVDQTLEDGEGRRTKVTRVVDVRLQLVGGRWDLVRVASVGGAPARRPATLSPAARQVLDSPSITLSDPARWDVYRGTVDDSLLTALATVARRRPLAVTVFKSGHPPYVWATNRLSAHASGRAADIYAIGGELVTEQRQVGSPAYEAAAAFVAGGAYQVGSPWVLGAGGFASFTDDVHADHVHVHQTA